MAEQMRTGVIVRSEREADVDITRDVARYAMAGHREPWPYVLPMSLKLLMILALTVASSVRAEGPPSCARFKIGVIAPFTGGMAEFGVATRNGIELALRSNSEYRHSLELFYEDSKYDPAAALAAFRKLVTFDGVDLVFNWGTGPNQAVAPVAEDSRTPLLAMTTEGAVSLNRRYVIRYSIYAEQYSLALLAYLRKRNIRTFDVVTSQVAYFEEVLFGIRRNLSQDEEIRSVIRVTPNDQDFRSLLPRLANSSAQGLGVFLIGGQLSQFFLQSKGLLPGRLLFGSNTFDNPGEIKRAQGAMDGAVYPSVSVTEAFRTQYLAAYNSDVQVPFAAMGFDLVNLSAKVASCRRIQADEIMRGLRATGPILGAAGKLTYLEPLGAGPGFDFPITVNVVTSSGSAGKPHAERW